MHETLIIRKVRMVLMPCKVLIVGCGFAGATIARTLAEAGVNVVMIDKRSHIGGNAFDEVHDNGERLHRYGHHMLHVKSDSEQFGF